MASWSRGARVDEATKDHEEDQPAKSRISRRLMLRFAATGLYVAVYYLGGSVGATALSYPWKHGGWLAIVASLLVAQAISGTLAWRFFSRGHHEAETPDPAALGA